MIISAISSCVLLEISGYKSVKFWSEIRGYHRILTTEEKSMSMVGIEFKEMTEKDSCSYKNTVMGPRLSKIWFGVYGTVIWNNR